MGCVQDAAFSPLRDWDKKKSFYIYVPINSELTNKPVTQESNTVSMQLCLSSLATDK